MQNDNANKVDLTALFNISYGLYVITSNDGNRDNGIIVNTVTQVTNTPNRIAVAINKESYSYEVIHETGKMNINCLTTETPFEIFERFGEEYFRALETQVIKEVSQRQGLVIATGGGAVLRQENIDALKQNGKVIFIDRPLSQLLVTDDRPLSKTYKHLEQLYNQRYDIYNAVCDLKINADGDINTNLKRIKEGILNENFSN